MPKAQGGSGMGDRGSVGECVVGGGIPGRWEREGAWWLEEAEHT